MLAVLGAALAAKIGIPIWVQGAKYSESSKPLKLLTFVNMVLTFHKNHKMEGGGGGGGGGGEDGGGGRGRLYTYCYTVTTRMTPALRWAVMRAILMFH